MSRGLAIGRKKPYFQALENFGRLSRAVRGPASSPPARTWPIGRLPNRPTFFFSSPSRLSLKRCSQHWPSFAALFQAVV